MDVVNENVKLSIGKYRATGWSMQVVIGDLFTMDPLKNAFQWRCPVSHDWSLSKMSGIYAPTPSHWHV
jgi:hypothetical protein